MEEQWLLINFQELLKSILNGNRCIQEPISIANRRRDTSSKVSFLNLLLSYKNIHKDNILEVLASIYDKFIENIDELKENNNVQMMMDRINNEWYDPNYIFLIKNPLPNDFFDINKRNKEYHDRSCKVCEEVEQLSKIENNIPLKLKEGEHHPLEKHFQSSIQFCNEGIQYLEENCLSIRSFIQELRNVDMTQFIDLSIKHKSIYLKLSESNEGDEEIPENIHRIFSNYIHIHNLFLKQLIQYYHYVEDLLNHLKEKCQEMKSLKQNVSSIAYLYNEEEEGVEEEGKEEEELTVVDGEILTKEEDGNEGNVFNRIVSFF